MTQAVACVVGLILVALGFLLSPWPWVAPIPIGAGLLAFGLLSDDGVSDETDR